MTADSFYTILASSLGGFSRENRRVINLASVRRRTGQVVHFSTQSTCCKHAHRQTRWCLICGLIDNELLLTKMNQGERKKYLGEELDEEEGRRVSNR